MTVGRLVAERRSLRPRARYAREPLPEHVPRARRVRHPRQPQRSVRSDGAGVHAARRRDQLAGTEHLHDDWTLVREYPLSRERPRGLAGLAAAAAASYVVAARARPRRSATSAALDPPRATAVARAGSTRWRSDGLRVLGVARGELPRDAEPARRAARLRASRSIGLVGLADPVRPTVRAGDRRSATRPASASS